MIWKGAGISFHFQWDLAIFYSQGTPLALPNINKFTKNQFSISTAWFLRGHLLRYCVYNSRNECFCFPLPMFWKKENIYNFPKHHKNPLAIDLSNILLIVLYILILIDEIHIDLVLVRKWSHFMWLQRYKKNFFFHLKPNFEIFWVVVLP